MRPDGKHHTLKDLYHERTHFDFLHRKWRWALLSGVVLLAGLAGFLVNGLNLGIDFTGGTVWELTTHQSPSTATLRSTLEGLGVKDPKIVIVGSKGVRAQGQDLSQAKTDKITEALAQYGGISRNSVSVSSVGPTWGATVSSKALRALIIFFFVIALYLSLRFTIKMATAAIIAVIHDILITIGVYAITGFEVTPATVIAFLTILGFSLYDTVVVFDKIRENERLVGTTNNLSYTDMANTSLNQVLMRSLNTSFVALLPVALAARRRRVDLRRARPARLRSRAVRRSAHRCVLLDLRGHADPRLAQGARAQAPGRRRPGRDPRAARRGPRVPGRAGSGRRRGQGRRGHRTRRDLGPDPHGRAVRRR